MSRHLDKLDDLFARFDALEAETVRQSKSADDLLLSISDTLTNPEENTEDA